jgi:hypothetical protein
MAGASSAHLPGLLAQRRVIFIDTHGLTPVVLSGALIVADAGRGIAREE